jgi:hypothetical protein
MTLQALKDAEFETGNLRVVPVTPGPVTSLQDLPLLSYDFIEVAHGLMSDTIFYDVIAKRDHPRHQNPNAFRAIAKQMNNVCFGLQVRPDHGRFTYWNTPIEFLAQTMQNMFGIGLRTDPEGSRQEGAAIHGRGHVYVPLPKGASMRILSNDRDEDNFRWDVIIEGEINFFGEVRPFHITHSHCQGFEFPENIDVIMEEVMAAFYSWFPWCSGHVVPVNAKYHTNPVSHQKGPE